MGSLKPEDPLPIARPSLILSRAERCDLPLEGIMGKSYSSAVKRFRLVVLVSVVAATVTFPYPLMHKKLKQTRPVSI